MKKIYALLLFLFFHSYFCQSQPPGDDNDNPVEVVKMAYMTRELNLSPEEAQRFWPVYNNYQNEIRQARNQYKDNEVLFERKVVEIKQRYQGNFKRVLGNNGQRINKVYTADKQFNGALRTELKNRQRQKQNFQQQEQQPKKQFQQQQQTPRKNGNNPNRNNNVKRGNGGGVKKSRPPF